MTAAMPWLPLLHLAAGAVWLLLALWAVAARAPPGWRRHAEALVAALMSGAALPLASAAGWWVDMPARLVVPHIAVAALLLALFGPERLPGRLAALFLAGFWLLLGAASLRNATPLAPWLALKAILFGLALLLLPADRRLAAGATALLLVAAATLSIHRGIPLL